MAHFDRFDICAASLEMARAEAVSECEEIFRTYDPMGGAFLKRVKRLAESQLQFSGQQLDTSKCSSLQQDYAHYARMRHAALVTLLCKGVVS